jgi:5-methyltetrahydrofolate--homocysteine methyltransferase
MDNIQSIIDSLIKGDPNKVAEFTQKAIDENHDTKDILDNGLIAGMAVIGKRFKAHDIFLPDVLLAAKAMYAGLDLLKPLLLSEGISMIGKVVIGTVQGDLHDIGKNLIGIMLEGAGFEVIDLGSDVAPEKFLEAAIENKAEIIGMSALLTTTMPVMKKVVNMANDQGIRDNFKIIIGGAPLSNEYANEIGADAYCFDGVSSVECVKRFLGVN